ncbi:hypothetical protein ACWDTP_00285 [Mycobacterium sp. NPDC003449]
MTSTLRFLDRLLTALLGIALLAGAVWLIGYGINMRQVRDGAARLDPRTLAQAPDWSWWPWALGLAGVLVLLIGVWLLLAHVRPTAVRTLAAGDGKIDLDRLAATAADDLGRHTAVERARATTRFEGGRPVVRIALRVAPGTPPTLIRQFARRCGEDLRRASGADVDVQLLVDEMRQERVSPQPG